MSPDAVLYVYVLCIWIDFTDRFYSRTEAISGVFGT